MKKFILLFGLIFVLLVASSLGAIGLQKNIVDSDCTQKSFTFGQATSVSKACYSRTFTDTYSDVDYIDLKCNQGESLYIHCDISHCDETGCPPCVRKTSSYSRPYRYYHASEHAASSSSFYYVCWNKETSSNGDWAWSNAGFKFKGLKHTDTLPDCPASYNYDNNLDACVSQEVVEPENTCSDGFHYDIDYNICVIDDFNAGNDEVFVPVAEDYELGNVYTPGTSPPGSNLEGSLYTASWWDQLVKLVKEFLRSLGLGSLASGGGVSQVSGGGGSS